MAVGCKGVVTVCVGSSRTSTNSFFVHHVQRMSAAAQRWDAAAILDQIRIKKRQICSAGNTGGAAF